MTSEIDIDIFFQLKEIQKILIEILKELRKDKSIP